MSHDELARTTTVGVDVPRLLDSLEIVLQPVVDLATGETLAVEALARFPHLPDRSSGDIIAEAHRWGYGYTLEAACLRAALARRDELPSGVRLAVNVSPDVLHHPEISRCWKGDVDDVIVEVTEHVASSPAALYDQIAHLRLRGIAIAVDDVGTGYAGLLRLATMRPDFVKIDRTVVAGVRDSAAQTAVLESLVTFSHRMGAAVIGEGVESLDDLVALAEFDVDYGQGWAIGRPAAQVAPISRLVIATCQHTRRRLLQRHAVGVSAAHTHGMHAVTHALARASGLAELHTAAAQAAREIGVDTISLSALDDESILREVVNTGGTIDTVGYPVAEYPVTQTVLRTGNTVEVHLSDPAADEAEKLVLERHGQASLLIIPVHVKNQPVGILEFANATHRRWTSQDIAHGRGLANHMGDALVRIAG